MKKYLFISSFLYALVVLFSTGGCSRESPVEPIAAPPGKDTSREGVTGKYGQSLVLYAEVDKAGNYLRRMFIDSGSAQAFRRTGTLPNNALLLMETWFDPDQSTGFIRRKQGVAWLNGSFSPGSPNLSVAPNASCSNCHARAAVTDMTFTRPLLEKALQRQRLQLIACNEPSFTPCDLSVYQGN